MKNDKDILLEIAQDLYRAGDEGEPEEGAVPSGVERLKEIIEDNERAHTKELEELDRKWREKVAGLRMGQYKVKLGTKAAPLAHAMNEAARITNSKINKLLEEE